MSDLKRILSASAPLHNHCALIYCRWVGIRSVVHMQCYMFASSFFLAHRYISWCITTHGQSVQHCYTWNVYHAWGELGSG